MASRLRIIGVVLIIIGIVAWGAAGYAFLRAQDGSDALQGFSEAQNVTLAYNGDGELIDRGTTEGAQAIYTLLGDDWHWPIDDGELNPDDPLVNTATEYMFQMATIAYHTLTGTQTVVLTERVAWDGDGDGEVADPAAAEPTEPVEAEAEASPEATAEATEAEASPEATAAATEAEASPEATEAEATEAEATEAPAAEAETETAGAPVYTGGEWDPATVNEDAIFEPGVYQVPVDGRYWTDFDRLHPLDGPARAQAWNGTVHGLFAELGVGATTATSLQMALGIVGVTALMGLGFIVGGAGLVWAGMGSRKEDQPSASA